jgi:hypothetical protein
MWSVVDRSCKMSDALIMLIGAELTGHIHGIVRLPKNLIIGVRSGRDAPAACRRALVAANIFESFRNWVTKALAVTVVLSQTPQDF